MGGQLVTGTLGGSTPHVTSGQFGEMNIGIFGRGSYVLDVGTILEATVVSNNEVHVGGGDLIVQGRQITVDEAGVPFNFVSGTQGMLRNDIICATYHKDPTTGIEHVTGDVITGIPDQESPIDPPHTEGDIYSGDIIAQVPVFRVSFDGVNMNEPELLLPVLRGLDEMNQAWDSISSDPLVQHGVVRLEGEANVTRIVTVTFPTPFAAAPSVCATPNATNPQNADVSVTVSSPVQFDIRLRYSTSTSVNVHWIAVGKRVQ